MIIRSDGTILTTNHVIEDAAHRTITIDPAGPNVIAAGGAAYTPRTP